MGADKPGRRIRPCGPPKPREKAAALSGSAPPNIHVCSSLPSGRGTWGSGVFLTIEAHDGLLSAGLSSVFVACSVSDEREFQQPISRRVLLEIRTQSNLREHKRKSRDKQTQERDLGTTHGRRAGPRTRHAPAHRADRRDSWAPLAPVQRSPCDLHMTCYEAYGAYAQTRRHATVLHLLVQRYTYAPCPNSHARQSSTPKTHRPNGAPRLKPLPRVPLALPRPLRASPESISPPVCPAPPPSTSFAMSDSSPENPLRRSTSPSPLLL